MKRLLFLTIILFVFEQAVAQRLPVFFLDSDILLGKSEANCTFVDAHRVVWVGTNQGLLTYDSDQSIWIENPQIKSSVIYNIIQDDPGNILVSSSSGLWKIDVVGKIEQLSNETIQKVYSKGRAIYTLSTKNGISKFQNGKLNSILSIPDIEYFDFVIHNDSILIATSQGLYSLAKNTPTLLTEEVFIKIDKQEEVIFMLNPKGLSQLENGIVKKITDWSDFDALDVELDQTGMFWIISVDGQLISFDNLNFKRYNRDNNINLDKINSLLLDSEGILWLSGAPGILGVNTTLPFVYYDQSTGLPSSKISGLAFVKNQIVTFSESSKKVSFIDKNGAIKSVVTPVYEGITHVFSDNQTIYFIDKSNTLWDYQRDVFSSITQFKSRVVYTFDNRIESFVVLEDGQLFKPSANDVALLGNYNIPNKIKKADFKEGTLWVLDAEGAFTFFTPSGDKSIFKAPKEGFKINDFYRNLGDTVYLATNQGIGIYSSEDQTNIKFINTTQGLISNNVSLIHQDGSGQIWAQTSLGLSRIALDNNSDQLLVNGITNYTKKDGLLSHYFFEVVEDSVQGLWWCSSTGITHFDPLKELPNLQKPSIKVASINILLGNAIDSIESNYNFAAFSDTILLKNSHLLEIKAQAITYNRAHSAQILYKLRETDDWIILPAGTPIILEDLPPGKFHLQLKSKNSFGVESEDIAFINLEVLAPIWQQNWVYALAVGVLFLLGFVTRRTINSVRDSKSKDLQIKLAKELEEVERKSHQQILKTEKLKQLNELIRAQKEEMEAKNKEIEGQKYELALTNNQIKKQKDLILETGNKLKSSINYAQRIQDALMTTEIEIKESIDESFVYFRPRDVVSGDFFWFKKVRDLEDDRELLILAAVDCTGHGVPGAIMSVVGMNLLNSAVGIKKIYDPGLILTEMNTDIRALLRHDTTNVNDGMDMALVVIDMSKRVVKYAGAKNPMFHIENNEIQVIKADKNPIGGQQSGEKRTYTTHDIPLGETPRMFYLFSDGYQDQFGGEKGYKFLSKSFRELLHRNCDMHIIEQKTILAETFVNWKGDVHQTDDVLVMGFRA